MFKERQLSFKSDRDMSRKILFLLIALTFITTSISAIDTSKTTNITIAIENAFSMEFYTDQNVVYRDIVPFTNVDPSKSIVYPDGRAEFDGKSDVGVVCKSNAGTLWYFKIHAITNPPLTADKLQYYISQPYDRNTGAQADGTITQSPKWYPFSSTPTSVFTAGFHDMSNLPFGTLITINFALNPSGLNAGQAYSAAVVYTMTTAP